MLQQHNTRSLKLQEEYTLKHGKVGAVISKSKKQKALRYRLHKKAREGGVKVFPRKKQIVLEDKKINEAVSQLINEFGYIIQTSIK